MLANVVAMNARSAAPDLLRAARPQPTVSRSHIGQITRPSAELRYSLMSGVYLPPCALR